MGIVALVDKSQIISLDSNIFIRALDDREVQGEKARLLLEQIKDASLAVFISAILLEEFFVRVYIRSQNTEDCKSSDECAKANTYFRGIKAQNAKVFCELM